MNFIQYLPASLEMEERVLNAAVETANQQCVDLFQIIQQSSSELKRTGTSFTGKLVIQKEFIALKLQHHMLLVEMPVYGMRSAKPSKSQLMETLIHGASGLIMKSILTEIICQNTIMATQF